MNRMSAVLFIVMAIMISGCGGPNLPEPWPSQGVTVTVQRIVAMAEDPAIQLFCKSATFDSYERKVIIEGVALFGSYSGGDGGQWIGSVSVEGDSLILKLPPDAGYRISIGKRRYELLKLE